VKGCALHHISAHGGLQSVVAPTSLKQHHSLSSSDKAIWNATYYEEFDGLASIPTW
jgi:hypothetical protein